MSHNSLWSQFQNLSAWRYPDLHYRQKWKLYGIRLWDYRLWVIRLGIRLGIRYVRCVLCPCNHATLRRRCRTFLTKEAHLLWATLSFTQSQLILSGCFMHCQRFRLWRFRLVYTKGSITLNYHRHPCLLDLARAASSSKPPTLPSCWFDLMESHTSSVYRSDQLHLHL